MLRGSHLARVDEKGRLKVPAEFKRLFDEKYGQVFFITSFDGEQAEIFPMPEWEKIEATLAERPSSDEKSSFLKFVNYFGGVVEMDSAGRLLLPQNLREKAKLEGELAVIGMQNRVSAGKDDQLLEKLKLSPVTGEVFAKLSIQGM